MSCQCRRQRRPPAKAPQQNGEFTAILGEFRQHGEFTVLSVEQVCLMIYRFGQPEYFSFHSSVFVVQEVRTGGAGRAKPARVRAREIARAAAPPAQCLDRPCARAPWRRARAVAAQAPPRGGARAPWRRTHRRVAQGLGRESGAGRVGNARGAASAHAWPACKFNIPHARA